MSDFDESDDRTNDLEIVDETQDIEIVDETNLADNDDESEEELSDDEESEAEMEDVVDEATVVFGSHDKPVLCCALNGDSTLAASGGQDDKAFVFSPSGQVMFQCDGHKDSVIAIEFSAKSKYLATGDMSGYVQIWEVASTNNKIFEHDFGEDLLWLHWHPIVEDIFLAGTNSGITWMLKIKGGQCKMYQGTGMASVVGCIFRNGQRAVVGYDDGYVKSWDLKNTNSTFSLKAHSETITTMDINNDDTLVLTGSVDGTSHLINLTHGKEICIFNCANERESEESDSVESVCFAENFPLVATGTAIGFVEIWDIPSQTRRNMCASDFGVSKLLFDKKNNHLLYAAGLNGVVNMYDIRSGKLELSKTGHINQILDFSISHDSSFLLTASEDCTCRIFNM
ncbi:angio-associated migratory cell protein-like protein [Dinothrombium tinctorium]|uniref:Angio-associated migratory cell protein-like protein n=1 Tax=Dinothrombium tinctorium TaxID=1965070 RepID=A0A443RFI6_9ACAR|nr:angio-associated migratory cell protein-like protein [Dinothrombium tinctorium]